MTSKKSNYADAKVVNQESIPVIDLSGIMASNTESVSFDELKKVGELIHAAAKEVGFFYIRGHGISPALIDSALSATQTFFNLSIENKSNVAVDQYQKGWMRPGMANMEGSKTYDLKEVFFYGREIKAQDAHLKAQLPMVSLNRWPNTVCPQLKNAIMAYHSALCHVGASVLSAIAVGFDLKPDFFNPFYERPLARGQLVYYPASTTSDEEELRYGVAPHTDFGVLTLLYQDNSGGLQVKSRVDGWIEAPPIADTLVCNTGDLLQRWTAGLFTSTVHRVINRSGSARYSMPLFYDPSSDALIDAAALGLDPNNQTPVRAGEHIAGRNQKNFSQYK